MTSGGAHAARFAELPGDVASLVRVVQGLLLHLHWAQAYGVELSDERRGESHLRPTDRMLDRLLAHDDRPLSAARPLDTRLVGTCRDFTVLLVALLRAKGILPAPAAASAAISTPSTSWTTGSASTGTPPRRAGSSSTRRSTTFSGRR